MDDDAAHFYAAARAGVYLIKTCRACGASLEPSLIACKHCASLDLEHVASRGTATLVAVSRIHRSFDPNLGTLLPLDVGVARLAEGPLLIGRLQGDPSQITARGGAVSIGFVQRGEAFVPLLIPCKQRDET